MSEVALPPVSSATAGPVQDDHSLQRLRTEMEPAAGEAAPTSGSTAHGGNAGDGKESREGEGEEGMRRGGEEEEGKRSSELSEGRVSQLSQFLLKQQEVVYR